MTLKTIFTTLEKSFFLKHWKPSGIEKRTKLRKENLRLNWYILNCDKFLYFFAALTRLGV